MTRPSGAEARSRAVASLEGTRTLVLYLLSLHAVSHALLAWHPPTASSPWRLAVWALGLWAATLLGQWLGSGLDVVVAGASRARLRIMAGVAYTAVAVVAPPLAAAAPEILPVEVTLFAVLQVVLLALAGGERGRLVVLQNALVLVLLAALRGGALSAGAVSGCIAGTGVLLALDHALRAFGVFPRSRLLSLRVILGRVQGTLVPIVLLVGGTLLLVDPAPAVELGLTAPDPVAVPELFGLYRALTLLGLVGGGGIFLLGRLLKGSSGSAVPEAEIVETVRIDEERLEPEPPPTLVHHGDARGRIVEAYLGFLAQAARWAARRRPGQTPWEFARQLREPSQPITELTGLFVRARYGPGEPSEAEAAQAVRAAREVVRVWRARAAPPRRA